jgi:hypothetical protein
LGTDIKGQSWWRGDLRDGRELTGKHQMEALRRRGLSKGLDSQNGGSQSQVMSSMVGIEGEVGSRGELESGP